MLICGIKLTHDAAVAVIDAQARRLLFSVEVEKIHNNARYSAMDELDTISVILHNEGVSERDVSFWSIDGWKRSYIFPHRLSVEAYHEFDAGRPQQSLIDSEVTCDIPISGRRYRARSYRHMASHVVGSYVASPFAVKSQPAYVLTWDGGQNPRVYYVDPTANVPVKFVAPLFEFYGLLYGIMGYYHGPYRREDVVRARSVDALPERPMYGGRETPGKLMSYIALGTPSEALLWEMERIYARLASGLSGDRLAFNQDGVLEHEFMRALAPHTTTLGDADVLASVHLFLQRMLVRTARAAIPRGVNLIFTGGSALNIKWNSALRACGHFASVWVPPFCNDTGTALGAAACEAVHVLDAWSLNWSVYAGPRIPRSSLEGTPCTAQQLAERLAERKHEPVVVLHGRAEIGPRALGNRSILMSAELAENKTHLNNIKRREAFRPVAPICMEEHAAAIFDPGTPDPYMLFDHAVRPEWKDRIPAVVHLDGTARLQTVNARQNPFVYSVLAAYYQRTGVPLLCNTSANFNGAGFFPDVASALRWGGAPTVWSDGQLFFAR